MKNYFSLIFSAVLLLGTSILPILAEEQPEPDDGMIDVQEETLESEEERSNETEEGSVLEETDRSEISESDLFLQDDGTKNPDSEYSFSQIEEYKPEEELLNADPANVTYNLWLGSTQVTDKNCSNILDQINETNAKPTASYDPATHVLTLNDPVITEVNNRGDAVIHSLTMPLIIEGTATINASKNLRDKDVKVSGVYANGGNLTIRGKDTVIDITVPGQGIYLVIFNNDYKLIVNDAVVNVTAGEHGIASIIDAEFNHSTVNAAGAIAGIMAGDLTINGGYIHAEKTNPADPQHGAIAGQKGIHLSDVIISTPKEGVIKKNSSANYHYVVTSATDETIAYEAVIAQPFQAVFHANYEGSPEESVQSWIYNEEIKLNPNSYTREGYTFSGWNTKTDGTGTAYADEETMRVNSDLDLYAQWKPIDYSITYDLNGGAVSGKNPVSYNAETSDFTLNNPTRTGYEFLGWIGSNGTTAQKTVTVKTGTIGNLAYTAKWKAIAVNSVKVNPASLSLDIGSTAVLAADVSPSDSLNKKVTWKSSNTKVAAIDANGKVTGKAAGTADITVTTEDGGKTATCKVIVQEPQPSPTPKPTPKPAPEPTADPAACKAFGFCEIDGKDYWYENSIRQGTYEDPKGVIGDGTKRGREIYDPESNAWYWLDSVYEGAKATGKEVWIPYVYQNEADWRNNQGRVNEAAAESYSYTEAADGTTADMVAQIRDAILNGTGKWVRYDGNGKMMKGWVTINNGLEKYYPGQAGNTYYYDYQTGMMAKGWTKINGKFCYFDEVTGVLR